MREGTVRLMQLTNMPATTSSRLKMPMHQTRAEQEAKAYRPRASRTRLQERSHSMNFRRSKKGSQRIQMLWDLHISNRLISRPPIAKTLKSKEMISMTSRSISKFRNSSSSSKFAEMKYSDRT